jgi:hypothetical protein
VDARICPAVIAAVERPEISNLIIGYSNRVLGGVSDDALAVDDSTLDRLRERAKAGSEWDRKVVAQ